MEKGLESWGQTVNLEDMTSSQPIPKNLREQLVEKVQSVPEKYLALLYEAWLDTETVRLLDEMNEQASGKWDNLPDLIREYRTRRQLARQP
jgi:hypothetical protein